MESSTLKEISELMSYAGVRHFIYNYQLFTDKINNKLTELIEKIVTLEELVQALNFADTALMIRHNDSLNYYVKTKFLNFLSNTSNKDIIFKILSSKAFSNYFADYDAEFIVRYFQLRVDPEVDQDLLQEIAQPLADFADELLKNTTDIYH